MQNLQDTITAPATPAGVSALAVVRVSGPDAIAIVTKCFNKDITAADGYTIHYGHIVDGNVRVDEVLASVFRNPQSYTGEDSVEISGHGSPYITKRIIETLLKSGARMAEQQVGRLGVHASAQPLHRKLLGDGEHIGHLDTYGTIWHDMARYL